MGKKDDVRLSGQELREAAAKRLAAQKPKTAAPVEPKPEPALIVYDQKEAAEIGRALAAYRKYREKMKLKMRKRRAAKS